MTTKIITESILSIILIVAIIISGISLHKKGKPYNSLKLTVHKLATIAIVVLVVIIFIPYIKMNDLSPLLIITLILIIISSIGLLASGGLMSVDKNDDTMLTIHRLSTVIFLISASALAYTLINSIISN